jgi:hypothetical protein
MAFRSKYQTVFVYGFAKSERDNIGPNELEFWRKVAASYLTAPDAALHKLMDQYELEELNCNA